MLIYTLFSSLRSISLASLDCDLSYFSVLNQPLVVNSIYVTYQLPLLARELHT